MDIPFDITEAPFTIVDNYVRTFNAALLRLGNETEADTVARRSIQEGFSVDKQKAFEWQEDLHPRDDTGKWTDRGGGAAVDVARPVFTGEPVRISSILSKQETGRLGERLAMDYLRGARPLNLERSNFPLDLIKGSTVYEVKAGLVSNQPDNQKWRLTIGEPGKKEAAWLAKVTPEVKAAWNARKQRLITQRKQRLVTELSRRLGKEIKLKTLTMIINPDQRAADLFEFEGVHDVIRWRSPESKAAYQRTLKYSFPDHADRPGHDEHVAFIVPNRVLAFQKQVQYVFDEDAHPRHEPGSDQGGQFAPKEGGKGSAGAKVVQLPGREGQLDKTAKRMGMSVVELDKFLNDGDVEVEVAFEPEEVEVRSDSNLARGATLGRVYLGQGYEKTGQYLLKHSDATLVHGTITGAYGRLKGGLALGHSWVEIGDKVFDGVTQHFYTKDSYYRAFKAKAEKTYSFEDAIKQMVETKYFGPWHATEGLTRKAA